MWHSFWWTYTGCGYHNAPSISCVCWCTAAWMEQRQDTCPTWQCLLPELHVVSSVQRQPPIWWCHQLVAHPSETVHLPWQVHERGTVYRQLSAQPPHRLLPLKRNLNHFCLDCHSLCDNVYCLLTMFSALAAVCTVYCATEIVLITLHYITLLWPRIVRFKVEQNYSVVSLGMRSWPLGTA